MPVRRSCLLGHLLHLFGGLKHFCSFHWTKRIAALSDLQGSLIDKVGMEVIRKICDTLNSHQSTKGLKAAQKAKFTPQEVCRSVFAWIHNEEAVDAQYLRVRHQLKSYLYTLDSLCRVR